MPAHLLDPAWRVPAVARHVAALDADLVCMQEVEPDVFAAVISHLEPLGYARLYEQKGRGRPDGCAPFYRTAAFTAKRTRRFEYHDSEGGPDEHSGSVALLAALEWDGHALGVASTHVKWAAPGTPRDAHIGHRQVAELVEACRGFGPPCRDRVVCGDFNYTPDDEVTGVMRDAGFAFAHADRPDARTFAGTGTAKRIDYVFHTAGLRSRPLDPPAITDDTKFPSEDQPPDHLALVAELDWSGD